MIVRTAINAETAPLSGYTKQYPDLISQLPVTTE